MKRVVSSSLITLFIIILVASAFFYFRNFKASGGDPIKAIPADAAFFFSYDPSGDKLESLLGLNYRAILEKAPAFDTLFTKLSFLDSLTRSNEQFKTFITGAPLFVSAHKTAAGEFDFLLLKTLDSKSSFDEIVLNIKGVTGTPSLRNYDGNVIHEVPCSGDRIFSYSSSKGILFGSFTSFLVEDALRQLKIGKPVTGDFKSLSKNTVSTGLNIFVNFNTFPSWLGIFTDNSATGALSSIRSFSNWAAAGIKIEKSALTFEGSLEDSDTLHYMHCLSDQQPVSRKLIDILPRKSAFINYYGLSNFQTYYKKLSGDYLNVERKEKRQKLLQSIAGEYKLRIEDKMLEWIDNEYALVITEPSGNNFDNNCYAIFRAKKIKDAVTSLKTISRIIDKKTGKKTMEESYNGRTIGFIRLNGVLPALFGESFNRVSKMYYTSIDNYIIFGNQAASLRTFIDDHQTGMLLVKTDYYNESVKSLPAKANRFFYFRPSAGFYLLKSPVNSSWKNRIEKYKEILSGFNSFSVQVSRMNGVNQMHAVMDFAKVKMEEGVRNEFSIEADSSVTIYPLLTTDPVSKTRQILFQDNLGNLILSDNNGNVIWKKHFEETIMGGIYEIDLFRNNTRQFLFNTSNFMYLVDTDGNPVGNYPIRLPATATNGLSVFDFDNNKDFKIYVACSNSRIYAYMASGKPLPGWNYMQNAGTVTDPIRLIKINGKDLLLVNDREAGASVVSRYGESALTFSQSFIVAKNSTVNIDTSGTIITTDPFGSIVKVNSTGMVEMVPLNIAGPDHGFAYADADDDGEKDYLFADGKEITAYNTSLALIYRKVFEENITGPLHLLNLSGNLNALGIQSDISNKTWLIRLNGSIYPGFPVKGNSVLMVDELNLDGKKNLITGSSEFLLNVYRLE